MTPSAEERRNAAEVVVARELARAAERNAGMLAPGYAGRIYQTLREEGLGIRRQDALRLIGEYAEYLQLPGRVARSQPGRFAPAKSGTALAFKREAALDVVARMRRQQLSLAEAVRQHNRKEPNARVSAESVKRLVPRSLEKRGSHWRATRYDRYRRTTDVMTTEGIKRVTVGDSRTASLISRHGIAVRAFLSNKADEGVLREFRGKKFQAGKRIYTLETDPGKLERLGLGENLGDLEIGSGQDLAA